MIKGKIEAAGADGERSAARRWAAL